MKTNLFKLAKKGFKASIIFAKKNSPTILASLAVVGVGLTAISSAKASVKAKDILDEMPEDTSKIEKGKALLPVIVPPVISATATIACIVGSNRISYKRLAAITTAYSISELDSQKLKDKLEYILGPEKAEIVEKEVASDFVRENPVNKNTILYTGHGDTLCYDPKSGRYFKSSPEFLMSVASEFKSRLYDETMLDLNDLYFMIGLDNIDLGRNVGWDISSDQRFRFKFSSTLTEENIPVLVLDYNPYPIWHY